MSFGKRALSLLLALVIVAGFVPWEMMPEVLAVGGDGITIDFNYAEDNNVKDPRDAMNILAQQNVIESYETGENFYKDAVNNPTLWRHCYLEWGEEYWDYAKAKYVRDKTHDIITIRDNTEGSLRDYLTSEDPADKYIVIDEDDIVSYHARTDWKTMVITTDKVLDLNGHTLAIGFDRNRNNSDSKKYQNPFPEVLNCTAFDIQKGATLTIIDSSAWRGEGKEGQGTGKLSFTAYMIDPYKYDINYYTTRDLFHVSDGNLVIYGGTFQAGRQKDQFKSNFSWSKLKTTIGKAVGLGVSIAEYASGISVASAKYQDVVEKFTDMTKVDDMKESGDDQSEDAGTSVKRDGSDAEKETKKSTLTTDVKKDPEGGRNQTVAEKKEEKNDKINSTDKDKHKDGTPEGENKANKKETAKDDKNTKIAESKKAIADAALDSGKIEGMVGSAFTLVENIAGMFGYDEKTRVTQSIKGTVVYLGTKGTFTSYGGKFVGYGDTPNTKNAVIECTKLSGTRTFKDQATTKDEGGMAYIFGGTFEARAGANVFNMVRSRKNQTVTEYVDDGKGNMVPRTTKLDNAETGGLEVLYFEHQGEDVEGDLKYEPVSTRNIQVRGGTFRCYYEPINLAIKGENNKEHFAKYPGTPGSVNLGIESYGEDLIQDGRIQVVDSYGDGALVLLDERTEEEAAAKDLGLYHYRLFCGDNELRAKTYLTVYPAEPMTNTAASMQLATYYGKGKRVNSIWTNDPEGENIRAPMRQTENYFNFLFDDEDAANYSIRPNFHNYATGAMDVWGEHLANNEIWYYPAPLDADGIPIGDVPYAYAYFTGKTDKRFMVTSNGSTAAEWDILKKQHEDAGVELEYRYGGKSRIRTNMKYFVYKIYRVDPLTRENISESPEYGVDEPLIEVRYGGSDDYDSLKCKLPLLEVEEQIKRKRPSWKGYQAGELYRVVLSVEEHIGINYSPGASENIELPVAKSESTILFRCSSKRETLDTEERYKAIDYTPLQWMYDVTPGVDAYVQLVNGYAGITDFEHDNKLFDVYYQWWEVDEDGKPLRMIAGTDNVFDDPNGTLEDKANHKPSLFQPDTDPYNYYDSVSPEDRELYGPLYFDENGMPKNIDDWKYYNLHMYTMETTPRSLLTGDGTGDLTPENNDKFATNSDSCYIPEDMVGKYIQVKAIVLNYKWSNVYDQKQTFYSHVAQVKPPLEGQVFLNKTYTTHDKPLIVNITSITGDLAASDPKDLSYQWQSSQDNQATWQNIPEATDPFFTTPTGGSGDLYFRLVVTSRGHTGAVIGGPVAVRDYLPMTINQDHGVSIPAGQVNTPIEPVDLKPFVQGGNGTYHFSVKKGPEWLEVTSDGVLSGTRPSDPRASTNLEIWVEDDLSGSKNVLYIWSVGQVIDVMSGELKINGDLHYVNSAFSPRILTAEVEGGNAAAYWYGWYVDGEQVRSGPSNEYPIHVSDIGKTVTCKVIAGDGRTGMFEASVVPLKAVGPAAPEVTTHDPITESNQDGWIELGNAYGPLEISKSADFSTIYKTSENTETIEDLPTGTYYIRSAENSWREAGQSAEFTIPLHADGLQLLPADPIPFGLENTEYMLDIQATGGTKPYTFEIESGPYPEELQGDCTIYKLVEYPEGATNDEKFEILKNADTARFHGTFPAPPSGVTYTFGRVGIKVTDANGYVSRKTYFFDGFSRQSGIKYRNASYTRFQPIDDAPYGYNYGWLNTHEALEGIVRFENNSDIYLDLSEIAFDLVGKDADKFHLVYPADMTGQLKPHDMVEFYVQPNLGLDIGTYEVGVEARDASPAWINDNYPEFTFTVTQADLATDCTLAEIGDVIYNGQEQHPEIQVMSPDGNLVDPGDYEVEYGPATQPGTVSYTVRAKDGTRYLGTISGNFQIVLPSTDDVELTQNVVCTDTLPKTIDLTPYIPEDAGNVTDLSIALLGYSGGALTFDTDKDAKTVTFTPPGNAELDGEAVFDIGVGTQFYKNFNVHVTVHYTDKPVPSLRVEPIDKVYDGKALEDKDIVGTATDEGLPVEGTWVFTDPTNDNLKNAHAAQAVEVGFVPKDSSTYLPATGTLMLRIQKAEVDGQVAFTPVTAPGKTLADVPLSVAGDSFGIPGTMSYDLPGSTEVRAGESYTWIFTPTDSENYLPATGEVVLYEFVEPGHVHTLVEHPVSPVTCTENGVATAYWECEGCGKFFSNAAGTVQITAPDIIYSLGHDWGDWEILKEATQTEDGLRQQTCKNCHQVYQEDIPATGVHVHSLTAVAAVAATCTDAGTAAYWKCEGCGKLFSDAAGTTEITEPAKVPALGHNWGDWVTVKEPTETEEGQKERTCTRCGEKETETIPATGSTPVNPFTDVAETAYYFKPVMWAATSSPVITAGISPTTFEPNTGCTRAQVVTFLWRAAGRPDPVTTECPFTDVGPSAYYYKAVLWAVENKITAGTSADKFSPNATCTRGQIVSFLYRNAGSPAPESTTHPFTDVADKAYYYKAVLWAVENKITAGTSADKFSPNATCTRGQVVTFLYRDVKGT